MTLLEFLRRHAVSNPDGVALEFEGRHTSYQAFDKQTDALACRLSAFAPVGSRIAYLGKNNDRYFLLLFAAAKAGQVLVPLNWRLSLDEWTFILEDGKATRLFVDGSFRAEGVELCGRLALPDPLNLEDEATWRSLTAAGVKPSGPSIPEPHRDDVILQIYTSGTTGKPKGLLLTHWNALALRDLGLEAGLDWYPRADDTSLIAMPVAHIAGTVYGLFNLHSGGKLTIAREFDAARVLALMAESRATHALLVPSALRLLLDHAEITKTELPHFRYMTYGGSPIADALLARARAYFPCGFVQMYGLTETAGGTSILSPDDHDNPKLLRSAGRAMLGVELAILDPAGNHLPPGHSGEVAVRSEGVMKGYWQRPDATAEVIDEHGWLRTGDIGYLDEDGYLFIQDRAKDTIISGGENVYPQEIENLLASHPAVADVAIIGIPSERWGEEVKAIVVPRPGQPADADALVAWARQRIAAFKAPKSVDFIDELPRNASGKILRRILREPYWQGVGRRVG